MRRFRDLFKSIRTAITGWLVFSLLFGNGGLQAFIQTPMVPEAKAASDFSVKTGYYMGTGATVTVTGLGFQPELVMIKADSAVNSWQFKTSAMPTAVTSYLGITTADNVESEITFTSDGFTVGTPAEINTANTRYLYVAVYGSDCTSSGRFCVGSYTGTGASSLAVSTGFVPDLVIARRSVSSVVAARTSGMTTNHAMILSSASANDTTGTYLQSMDVAGTFTAGSTFNTLGGTYYYVAFKNLANKFIVGSFVGDGLDNKNITGVGFTPDFVFVKQNAALAGAFLQTESWGDSSSFTSATATAINNIQAFSADGFQVGTSTNVNATGVTSYYFAIGGAPDPTTSGSFYMARGSYTGNGTSQSIDTTFRPDLVFVKGNTAQFAVWTTSMEKDNTHYFASTTPFTTAITSMNATGFSVGAHATVNSNALTYEWMAFGNATTPQRGGGSAEFVIGAYTGTGVARSITNLGVAPNMVTVGRNGASASSWKTTAPTTADGTSLFFAATADDATAAYLNTLDSGGFTVGTNAAVNTLNAVNVFFGFKEGSNFDVGTYTGNGTSQNITGLGFNPDLVWVKRSTAVAGVMRSTSSTITGTTSQYFTAVANTAALISAFVTDGFTVSTGTEVNTNAATYRYAAWNATTTANPPATPTNSAPAAAATAQDLNVVLTGSAYSDTDGDSHLASLWQVDDDSDFSSPEWTRTSVSGEVTTTVNSSNGTFANDLSGKTELDHNTSYYWRVKYSDGVYGSYSTATIFTTNTIATPTNSSPASDATVTTLTPTLTASAFSDAQTGHTSASAQWQISTISDFTTTVYDSGTVSYTASLTVPAAVLADRTSYYWRVRYKDSSAMWSSWSTGTRFATNVSVVSVTGLIGSPVVDQGNTLKIDAKVALTNGTAINDATVTVNVYNPSGTKVVDAASMSYLSGSNGVYRYSYTVPATSGSYLYDVTATSNSVTGYGAGNFEVRTIQADVTGIASTLATVASDVTTIKANVATLITQIGTGNIAAIKTATDTINWANVTTIVTNTGAIQAKTDTIDWTDVAAIKTKTDTILWTDVTDIQSNADALVAEIGTGNIAAIKTATDTIDWADVTSILTDTGIIKAKTDTIDWTHIGAIKTKTDTILWTDVTDIVAAVAAVQTTADDVQTKVTATQTSVDALVGALIVTQSTVNDASATTTSFVTALSNSTTNFYKNAVITFTSGALDGQNRRISAYNGTTKAITVDPALTSAPANGVSFTIVTQNVRVEEQVADHETADAAFRADTTARLTTIESKIDTITTTLNAVDTDLTATQTTVNNLRSSQQLNREVVLADVSEVQPGTEYRTTLTVQDYESDPVAPDAAPQITILDSTGATIQTATAMTLASTGVYTFALTLADDAVSGLWESRVTVDVGGDSDVTRKDYFQVTGSPAQVLINSISDTTIPTVAAAVTITNEGTGSYEYQYEWCVVTAQDNACGGGDDTFYGSAAKLLTVGENWNTTLNATVPTTGNYYFKLVVYYGTEASGASQSFTATTDGATPDPDPTPTSNNPGGGGSSAYVPPLSAGDEYASMRTELAASSRKLEMVLASLSMISPDVKELLAVSAGQTQSLKEIQNKVSDLRAVSTATRQIVERKASEPIVHSYMKFNSVVISFLITNPTNVSQTLKFKAFLPEEAKPEYVMDAQGLKVDYDTDAKLYFVSGDITLGPSETVTRDVELKDVWVFDKDELAQLKTQVASMMPVLAGSQYEAQGILLKNDIDTAIDAILRKQEGSYTSPQDHIVAYRENAERMDRVREEVSKMKDLVVQAGASRSVVGQVGGIQTFATWGIILAIVFGFGMLAAVMFAMWRHQTMLAAAAMGMSKEDLHAYFGKGKIKALPEAPQKKPRVRRKKAEAEPIDLPPPV